MTRAEIIPRAAERTPPLTRRRQLELIDSGLDKLRVSLDSSSPETYRKIRGIPAFDRVVHNLAERVRTWLQMASSPPRISIWMTGRRENLAELPEVIAAYQRFGEQLYSSEPPASCRNCGLAWSL